MDSQQLQQVEQLCDLLYMGKAAPESVALSREEAQGRLLALQSSADYIPQCQYVLDHSSNQYARLVASNSLIELLTKHWNNFTIPQRIDIRNYALGYLANNGPNLQDFVVASLTKLVCRITKLGWFDDQTHRELTEDVTKFLQASVGHCILGLKILSQLVEELNLPKAGSTVTQHRKVSVSFRDSSLFLIFQIALTTLKQLQSRAITAEPRQEVLIGELCLGIVIKCFSFDFIGTNPDESTEDVGTIQIPSSWASVIEDPETLDLLVYFYANADPPRSSRAMEAMVLLCSVRRSIFSSDSQRGVFLSHLVKSMRTLLANQTGLEHQDNYHQFCRLLARIKTNYQLNELIKVEGYTEWLELAASFTITSMKKWEYSTNSIHYLLALWNRLVAAIPYVRPDPNNQTQQLALQKQVTAVIEAYVESMLGSVETVLRSDGALDNPLEDEGSLYEQLERLPTLVRFQYTHLAGFLRSKFEPLLNQYREVLNHISQSLGNSMMPTDVAQRLMVLEGQLTWLTYIVGAVVGGHVWSSARSSDGEENIDASLSRFVLQLTQVVDYRLTTSGTNGIQGGHPQLGRSDPKLELSLLYYFQSFRRVYMVMWDQVTSSGGDDMESSVASLLGAALGSSKFDTVSTAKRKVYQRMFESLNMGDHTVVANLIVSKLGNNLKFWPEDADIIGKTLDLLLDMAGGYSSSKMLLNLDTVKLFVRHHTADDFPFLGVSSNARHRTKFHATLTRLLLSPTGETKLEVSFEQFMEPLTNTLQTLTNLSDTDMRQEAARRPLIGVFRDLRGVASSLHNRRTYTNFFDLLHPAYFPLFPRVASVWHDQPDVIISLLRFMQEFCHNKANRVNFDQSSVNGILLFRAVSSVVCAYGGRLYNIIQNSASENPNEIYKKRYKGITLILNALNTALGGSYVCFGVFKLYNDRALDDALDIALKLILSVPPEDAIAYPKLSKALYNFIEIIFRSQIDTVLALESNVFMQLMLFVHDGLQANDAGLCSQCATTIDHLATFYFNNSGSDKPSMRQFNQHLAAQPAMFSNLIQIFFNLLLFSTHQNHWAVMRPMLSLILTDQAGFETYKEFLLSTQSPDNQTLLNDAFNKLLENIGRDLENSNRDRFTQRLTAFRVTVRNFLTV